MSHLFPGAPRGVNRRVAAINRLATFGYPTDGDGIAGELAKVEVFAERP